MSAKSREQGNTGIQIIVATHKRYPMPDDPMYLPLHCGRKGKEDLGYQGDDTGDNLSEYNAYLNEMTGVYWAWKNLDADYIGVAHYRRQFSRSAWPFHSVKKRFQYVLDRETLLKRYLSRADVVVPNKRRYWVETNRGHYAHSSPYRAAELRLMETLLGEAGEEAYVRAFQTVLNRRWAHMFNMYIMRRDLFDRFNRWQFPLLLKFEKHLDRSDYALTENRAFISELMLDTWLEANGIPYVECPMMFMEQEHIIKKAWNMLLRKFRFQTS